MSSTRGDRIEHDDYPTPPWAVERLLDRVWLPRGRWIEPAAGAGHIVRTVNERMDVDWSAVELQERHIPSLGEALGQRTRRGMLGLHHGDFFEVSKDWPDASFDVAITNPTYTSALEFVLQMRRLATFVVCLLRVGWQEGGASRKTAGRAAFLAADYPDLHLLPNRPPFAKSKSSGKWGTDSTPYGWMVWGPEPRTAAQGGRVTRLAETPPGVRKAWLDGLRAKEAALG